LFKDKIEVKNIVDQIMKQVFKSRKIVNFNKLV